MNSTKKPVKIGLEKILDEQIELLANKRVGLICNQSSVNRQYEHAADLFMSIRRLN
jgi:uncharacterized protein YbbC (DUF1343 family)